MSLTTLTLLTQGTVWDTFRPKTFSCTFTEDTSIAYIDFFSGSTKMQRLLNVVSGVTYQVRLPLKLTNLFFVPDDIAVEKQLRITNILFDSQITFTEDPRVIVCQEDGLLAVPLITLPEMTFLNGVGSGASGLVPDAYVGMVLCYNGAVVGYVISNTETTVTISRTYTCSIPRTYQIFTRAGSILLNTCSTPQTVVPPNQQAAIAGAGQYTAPPWPFESTASAVERTSNAPVAVTVSAAVQQQGLPFSVQG